MNFKVLTILVPNVFLILCLFPNVSAQKSKLTYCVVDDTLTQERKSASECPYIVDSKKHIIGCIVAMDRVSCLRYLVKEEVDFIIAQPEDLMILGRTQDYNNKLLVTHQLGGMYSDQLSHKMVVIVRNNISDIWHTEHKRFCSPGFEPGVLIQDYVKFFENRIIIRKCDPEKSLLENRMASLSEYFESACISGPWTVDFKFNKYLKRKYNNLCAQCENASSCSSTDQFFGKSGAFNCLKAGKGDVTWATLEAVHKNLESDQDKHDYSFLCPDGKTVSLKERPCIWLEGPRRTIVTRRQYADKLREFISDPLNTGDVWRLFVGIPTSLELPTTPTDYLQRDYPEFYSLKDYANCKPDRSIKWCVTTDLEFEKCKWISFSAENHGLEPMIKCVQESSRQECMNSVKAETSDIFAVHPQEEKEAEKKGLKVLASMKSHKGNKNQIVALVHKFSNISGIGDLKNQKACFFNYQDAGWNTFIHEMQQMTGDKDWERNDKEMISKYFSESCLVDLHKKDQSDKDYPKNLFSLCSKSTMVRRSPFLEELITRKERSVTNIVQKPEIPGKEETINVDQMLLNCLLHNDADVTFVNLSTIMKTYPGLIGTALKVIYLNETSPDNESANQCTSGEKHIGLLMINNNATETRENDIYLMLMDLDRLFGNTYQFTSKLISMYGPFDKQTGVIFNQDTQYLERDFCSVALNHNYDDSHSPNAAVPLMKEICVAMVLGFFGILLLAFKIL